MQDDSSSNRESQPLSDRRSDWDPDISPQVQAIIAECLRRREAGETLTDDAVLTAYPDPELHSELKESLHQLQMIERAFATVDSGESLHTPLIAANDATSESRDRLIDDDGRTTQLRIRCPHCFASSRRIPDTPWEQVSCGRCGNTYQLAGAAAEGEGESTRKSVGHFELVERIGMGGFGTVWKARDRELHRWVAIKLPRRGRLSGAETEQFFREARATAQMRHPNIVPIHEVGSDGDIIYIVSDFIDGESLAARLSRETMNAAEAAEMCRRVARALQHAHESGVIHRDLKPANILLDSGGRPFLADFGMARRLAEEATVTIDGQLLGTPAYMSPEQARGDSHTADDRSDIYSLGVILFEAITGDIPFRGSTHMMVRQIIENEPSSPRTLNPTVPQDLATICLKCLEKTPSNRYDSAKALADDLGRFLRREPIVARPVGRIEHAWRWCRRYPAVATLSVTLASSILVGLAAMAIATHARRREVVAEQLAESSSQELRQRNERLKSAMDFLDRARRELTNHSWDDAAAYFDQASAACPDLDTAYVERGELFLRLGLVRLAAADFQRAFQLRRPSDPAHWFRHALLRLSVRDTAGYQRVCDEMLQSYKYSNMIARTLTLSSSSQCDPSRVTSLDRPEVEYQRLVAMANLRIARFDEAIAACLRLRDFDSVSSPFAVNYPILAIAEYHLGHQDVARDWMQKAIAANHQWLADMVNHFEPSWQLHYGAEVKWPIDCLDWLEFRILYREASELLKVPLGDEPGLRILNARGYAGLRRMADSVAEYDIVFQTLPGDERLLLEFHRVRALYHIQKLNFLLAADEYSQATRLSPDDYYLWRSVGIAHLASGNLDGYRRACREMVNRFYNTGDSNLAQSLVDTCTTTPDAIDDWNILLPAAELSVQSRGRQLLARTCFRLGRYDEARGHYESLPILAVTDRFFWAMTQFRLGHREQASQTMAEAEGWVKEADDVLANVSPRKVVRNFWGAWTERPQACAVRREARELILVSDTAAPADAVSATK